MKKNTITEVEIFSMNSTDGKRKYGIRCKVNGILQPTKQLSRDDLNNFNNKTNRRELAKKYFCPEPTQNEE